MEQNLKAGGSDASLTASARSKFRAKVRQAAENNPDLPHSFISESLKSLAEPREDRTPFVPRSRTTVPE